MVPKKCTDVPRSIANSPPPQQKQLQEDCASSAEHIFFEEPRTVKTNRPQYQQDKTTHYRLHPTAEDGFSFIPCGLTAHRTMNWVTPKIPSQYNFDEMGHLDKMTVSIVLIVFMIMVCDLLVTMWREIGRPIFREGVFGVTHICL